MPKTLKKPQKRNIARNIKHMTIVFDSKHFKYQIVLIYMFRGKQTKFEPVYAGKCKKKAKKTFKTQHST